MTDAETPRGRGPALAVASAGYFFVLLDVTIVNVALARIGSGLGGSRSELQWVIDAYALVLAAGMLGMGDLADRTGSRRLFLGGLVLFGGASALCAGGSALVLGPVLGDVLTGPLGWRSVFWLNVPLVAAALIGGALTLPPGSRTKGARLDLAGQFLGTAALAALVLALIEGGERGFKSPPAVAGIAVTLVAFAGFLAAEKRVERP